MIPNKFVVSLITSFLIMSCTHSETGSEKEEPQETKVSGTQKPDQSPAHRAQAEDSKLIPSKLVLDKLANEVSLVYLPNTDTVASLQVQLGKKSIPSLTLSAQINCDAAQLQRLVSNWTYQPGFLEDFNAGEQAVILLTEESSSSYYTVVFRTRLYFCTIVSKIKTGESSEAGILYNIDKLKELAQVWADYLKTIE